MLATTELREGARSLFERCPWRTIFGHPDFLEPWYRSRPELRPMLLVSLQGGWVDGWVPLARNENEIMFAGGDDVPVHGWLAEPLRGSFVLERHLAEVGSLPSLRAPLADRLRFTPPPHAPLDWLGGARPLGRLARVENTRRRVFRLDRERAAQKLDEKKNTSQVPQVKTLGPLSLKDARPEDLPLHLEWHRQKRHARGLQAALQSNRLALYRRLDPKLLSATVLCAGDRVLSSMLVYRDGPRAWLELLAENPDYERHSPGILHLYLLEERWIEEVVELDVTADDVVVTGDQQRLHQVLTNLLTNARRHTPAGTSVTVGVHPSADRSGGVVTVHDDGPGIPADLLDSVFERFTRGDTSRTRSSGGVGLGLSLARAITDAHGGSIDIDSRPGCTRFTVVLPA
jgi:CelD/BcsL family acetyltransferase involved in cellulose biosynthesis